MTSKWQAITCSHARHGPAAYQWNTDHPRARAWQWWTGSGSLITSQIAEGESCCVVTRSSPSKFISIRKLTTLILTWVIHLCTQYLLQYTYSHTRTTQPTQAWSVLVHNSVKSLWSWRLWRHYWYRYRWRSKVSVSAVSVISGIGLSLLNITQIDAESSKRANFDAVQ